MEQNINRIAQLTALQNIEMAQEPMPQPGPGEVRIKVEYCGICGSDMHFYQHGSIGKKVAPFPFVLGHECAGYVDALGADVTSLKVGDRVALEPGVPCGTCAYCRKGLYNLCPEVRFMAAPPVSGALKNYLTHPADMCFVLPDSMTLPQGALLEPLAVGMHAARRGGVTMGKSVCILGSGTIGIMTLLCCKAMGATRIIVSDLFTNRLASAKAFGADLAVNPKEQDLEQVVQQATGGQGCDIVFETAGSPYTMADTWKYVKRGGVITLVGNISKDVPYSFLEISRREVDIRPVFRYRNIYPLLIEAVSTGKINLEGIISREFPFAQSNEAFQYTMNHAQEVIKTMIRVGEG